MSDTASSPGPYGLQQLAEWRPAGLDFDGAGHLQGTLLLVRSADCIVRADNPLTTLLRYAGQPGRARSRGPLTAHLQMTVRPAIGFAGRRSQP